MEISILKEIGFSDREIKVYLALLELGETTVGPIASRTRIQHSKIYQTLEKLIDKGLISFIIKSKTKYFQAQNPNQILNMLKEKERRFSGSKRRNFNIIYVITKITAKKKILTGTTNCYCL